MEVEDFTYERTDFFEIINDENIFDHSLQKILR
jgi:hypothetical protein